MKIIGKFSSLFTRTCFVLATRTPEAAATTRPVLPVAVSLHSCDMIDVKSGLVRTNCGSEIRRCCTALRLHLLGAIYSPGSRSVLKAQHTYAMSGNWDNFLPSIIGVAGNTGRVTFSTTPNYFPAGELKEMCGWFNNTQIFGSMPHHQGAALCVNTPCLSWTI